jgi:hypothetical protein
VGAPPAERRPEAYVRPTGSIDVINLIGHDCPKTVSDAFSADTHAGMTDMRGWWDGCDWSDQLRHSLSGTSLT